jgi:hypothetical protein
MTLGHHLGCMEIRGFLSENHSGSHCYEDRNYIKIGSFLKPVANTPLFYRRS